MMKGLVNGVSVIILVDMGAAITVPSKDMWDRSKEGGAQLQGIADRKLVGMQGTPLHLHGSARIQLELPPEKFWISVIVADIPTADMILGRDYFRSQRCTIEMKAGGAEQSLSEGSCLHFCWSTTPCLLSGMET